MRSRFAGRVGKMLDYGFGRGLCQIDAEQLQEAASADLGQAGLNGMVDVGGGGEAPGLGLFAQKNRRDRTAQVFHGTLVGRDFPVQIGG